MYDTTWSHPKFKWYNGEKQKNMKSVLHSMKSSLNCAIAFMAYTARSSSLAGAQINESERDRFSSGLSWPGSTDFTFWMLGWRIPSSKISVEKSRFHIVEAFQYFNISNECWSFKFSMKCSESLSPTSRGAPELQAAEVLWGRCHKLARTCKLKGTGTSGSEVPSRLS